MALNIRKCISCERYTLKEECACRGKTILLRPPKFSLEDKYADLKRKVKKEELIEKGLY